MIDELLEVASLVDQPTPYLETLAHCLHEKNEEDFHKNIAFFSTIGNRDTVATRIKKE
ncbi:hypothetical protein MHB75_03910 [Kurthia sp. FSL E2-0154]|uniref:hypothetical protein n=1 Tax=Kurthia sp. FSL E2-0154 TaxID=2921358 RepID=UPI0030FB456B